MDDMIPYTHWAYFSDEAGARRCAQALPDFVTRVRKAAEGGEWLLLAGRDVVRDRLPERHREVEEIVTRHGGKYDGGEATYLGTGQPVADPMLIQDGEGDDA
ncbi:ribonuclease E inhibitor RraB [Streptomyces natalensis]|uniref:Regulator of ribonuclease activity B domain-containing protein n=1 Tax=Streptomyces natalensis ATCC 27448 TaxID=1240678 RepID=A0A0D7CLB2_9ACTN|nr:hypothetical protein SNA_17930 [Streptomyces natalensis ATCC 27448]